MNRPTKKRVAQALAGHYGHELCRVLGKDDDVCVLAAEVRALQADRDEWKAKYKRDLIHHSCGGGPNPCGGCCECMERQFTHANQTCTYCGKTYSCTCRGELAG